MESEVCYAEHPPATTIPISRLADRLRIRWRATVWLGCRQPKANAEKSNGSRLIAKTRLHTHRLVGVRPSFLPAFLIRLAPLLLDNDQKLLLHCLLNPAAVDKRQHADDRLQYEYDDYQNEILQNTGYDIIYLSRRLSLLPSVGQQNEYQLLG